MLFQIRFFSIPDLRHDRKVLLRLHNYLEYETISLNSITLHAFFPDLIVENFNLKLPRRAARYNGVWPSFSRASTSAPWLINSSKMLAMSEIQMYFINFDQTYYSFDLNKNVPFLDRAAECRAVEPPRAFAFTLASCSKSNFTTFSWPEIQNQIISFHSIWSWLLLKEIYSC